MSASSPGKQRRLQRIFVVAFLLSFALGYQLLADVSVGSLEDPDNDDLVAKGAVVVEQEATSNSAPWSGSAKSKSFLGVISSQALAATDADVLATETRVAADAEAEYKDLDAAFAQAVAAGEHRSPVVIPASQFRTTFFVSTQTVSV